MNNFFKIEQMCLIFLVSFLGCANAAQNNKLYYQKSEASELVDKAWQSLNEKKDSEALQISDQCIELYSEKAKLFSEECDVNNLEKYSKCQLFNDTAQCYFIKAKVYSNIGKDKEVFETCNELKKYYFDAFVFDPQGLPWKPAEACNSLIYAKHEI